MKCSRLLALLLTAALLVSVSACFAVEEDAVPLPPTEIRLSDDGVTVNGKAVSHDPADAVYVGADIIYYHDGTDASYGEGTDAEKHAADEAKAHTVVTITKPGNYTLTGSLSKGQIAVDLGKDAKRDPDARVILNLDNVSVTCTVAPALIFYNVYEIDQDFVAHDADEAVEYTPHTDIGTAYTEYYGANVNILPGTVNTFTGSHVARIYKEGTTKKLHKYDGAFYSRMSMLIDGVNNDFSGVLNIIGDNEGLDSELHLTINGGVIHIESQDDGINTNEDYVSVTTVNGGVLTIDGGLGAEGDGIDSNGYLVINGGHLYATAHPGADGGIDAEMPIVLNGGAVFAQGGRNDEADLASSGQPFIQLTFAQALPEGALVELQSDESPIALSFQAKRGCRSVTVTSPQLRLDTVYHVYVDGALQGWSGNRFGFGGMRPGGMEPPEGFAPGQRPDRDRFPGGGQPDAVSSATPRQPDGVQPPEPPQGGHGWGHDGGGHHPELDPAHLPGDVDPGPFRGPFDGAFDGADDGPLTTDFVLTADNRSFSGVRTAEDALPFTDLSPSDPAYGAVKALYRCGAMQGTGHSCFSPRMTVTRAQAITVLARLAGAEPCESDAFSDVEPGSWYAGYVGWASDNGIVQGDGMGHFYPDMVVTAEHMNLMLERYHKGYQDVCGFQGQLDRAQLARMAACVLP